MCLVIKLDASKRHFEKSEVRFAGAHKEKNTLTSRPTVIVTNQMNYVMLLDSSNVCLGVNLAYSNNENQEVNARERTRNMAEELPLGEID